MKEENQFMDMIVSNETEQKKLDYIYQKMSQYLKQEQYELFNMIIRNTIDHANKLEVPVLLSVIRWTRLGKRHTSLWPFLVGAVINDLETRGYIPEQIDNLLTGYVGPLKLQ